MRGKRGDATTLVIAGTLIITAIVIMGCAKFIGDIWKPGDANNANKINSHLIKINALTQGGQANKFEQRLMLDDEELILYYSAGNEPIKLLYTGSNTQDNGHVIIERPDYPECDNKACVCYCYQGLFWRVTQEKPFLEPRRLLTKENLLTDEGLPTRGWSCTNMICESTQDTQVIFTNSRGQDNQFTQDAIANKKQNDFQAIPLQIPLLLQGDYRGEDIYFSDQKNKHIEYLTLNYKWEGGIAIGGYAYSPSKKTRKENEFESQHTLLTVEVTEKEHVVGVCLQETCLYPEALANANVDTTEKKAREQAEQVFSNLEQYLLNDFPHCLSQAAITSAKEACAYSLQEQLARASSLDLTKNPYTVSIEEDTQGKTTFTLVNMDQGTPQQITSMNSGLIYPYVQIRKGSASPLQDSVHLTRSPQGNISLSNAPGVLTKLSITLTTQGTDEVIVFISS